MVFLTASLTPETVEKRLELKSLKRQTKAEELGAPYPVLFVCLLRLFRSSHFSENTGAK
jgi:hypothetical protein